MTDYSKDVLFLGAGASAGAGVPTLKDFFDKGFGFQFPDREKQYVEEIKLARSKLFPNSNIEEFYSYLDLLETNPKFKNSNLSDITLKLNYFVSATIEKSLMGHNPLSNCYENLLGRNYLKIITTNWDLLIEKEGENFSVDFTDIQEPNAKLLKLHGSMNWLICKKCLSQKIFDKKVSPIYYFNLIIEDKKDFKFFCEKCKKITMEPVIIPPIFYKQKFYSNLIWDIWNAAEKSMLDAEKIIFIGFSLPATDLHLRLFLKQIFQKKPNLEAIVVNPDPKVVKNFEEIVQKDKITYISKTFAEYFQNTNQ